MLKKHTNQIIECSSRLNVAGIDYFQGLQKPHVTNTEVFTTVPIASLSNSNRQKR